jgi:hypothetical protein
MGLFLCPARKIFLIIYSFFFFSLSEGPLSEPLRGSFSDGFQGLSEIGDQIFLVFQAAGHADQT